MVFGNRKNNKAQMAYQELALIIFSIVFVGLVLFVSSMNILNVKSEVKEISPEISYKFPATFVYGFLHYPINDSDIKDLGLDLDETYLVSDLIYIGTDKSFDLVENKYRKLYLNDMGLEDSSGNNVCDYYRDFSGNKCNLNVLIIVQNNDVQFENLNKQISSYNNYYFYLKTKNGVNVKVSFSS